MNRIKGFFQKIKKGFDQDTADIRAGWQSGQDLKVVRRTDIRIARLQNELLLRDLEQQLKALKYKEVDYVG
jgi:hypothetical protein